MFSIFLFFITLQIGCSDNNTEQTQTETEKPDVADTDTASNKKPEKNPLLEIDADELIGLLGNDDAYICGTRRNTIRRGIGDPDIIESCKSYAESSGYKLEHFIDDAVWKRFAGVKKRKECESKLAEGENKGYLDKTKGCADVWDAQ